MMTSATVTLIPIWTVQEPHRAALLAEIAALELGPGQDEFVGVPATMVELATADPQRYVFAVAVPGRSCEVVGMGVLHAGGVTDPNWPEFGSAILLRGFLIDHRAQGQGYGAAATAAAMDLAEDLVKEQNLPAEGVVLFVNERNSSAIRAYEKAGFSDSGRFLGGRSGPQRIMYRPF